MNNETSDNNIRTVLRMRAREGCEAQFEQAWRSAADAISRVPGNLRQELIRDAEDPRMFLITSDWSDHAALDEFGRSAARDELTAALRELREHADKNTYQVLHSVAAQPPRIRVVVTITVAEGQEAAYERAYAKVAERMRGTPGHVREELLREPGTSTYNLFAEWESEEAFNAWADDPAHLDQTAPILPYLLASFQRTTYHIVARPPESQSGPLTSPAPVAAVPAATSSAPTTAPATAVPAAASAPAAPAAAAPAPDSALTAPAPAAAPMRLIPDVLATSLSELRLAQPVPSPPSMVRPAPTAPAPQPATRPTAPAAGLQGSSAVGLQGSSAAGHHNGSGSVQAGSGSGHHNGSGSVQAGSASVQAGAAATVQGGPATVYPSSSAGALAGSSGGESTTDVLIVGAGPAGLTAAIELARRGVACRIIDKRAEPSGNADKAIGVQCRTMEIWEDIGVVREAIDAGSWLHGQTVFVNGEQTHQVDWDLPDLPYAHLGLPQYETERILTNRLADHGVHVERGSELIGFTQDDAGVTARLAHASGGSQTVRARYLVGCDGAHSMVRTSLGLTFEGGMGMFPQHFMLGDVDLDWSMPEGHLLRFIQLEDEEMKGMLVCVPLRGPGRFRVATIAPAHLSAEAGSGPIPPGFSREYTPPTLGDIQAVLDQLAPAGTTASNLRWSSIFRIKHGIVDRYRVGRVFVAGDAAHLHPPAGGQGMNTGIQDAWNLGWKLAFAVRGLAAPGLLDSYQAERRPAGKAIVDRAVRVAFTDEMDMDDEREQFMTEMQMTLSYAGSPLVGEALGSPDALGGGPKPGDRAPDVEGLRRFGVGHPLRLFELTQGIAHTLLVYADASTSDDEMAEFEKLAAKVRGRDPGLVNIYVLASPDASVPAGLDLPVLRDATNGFRTAYGVSGASAYLIRPDGHVGFRCAPVDPAALDEHLVGVFAA